MRTYIRNRSVFYAQICGLFENMRPLKILHSRTVKCICTLQTIVIQDSSFPEYCRYFDPLLPRSGLVEQYNQDECRVL